MEKRLIIFAGTVGAGKTTHLRLLQFYLSRKGINVRTVFLKTANLAAYLFLKIISMLCRLKSQGIPPITVINELHPTLFKRLSFILALLDAISIIVKDLICVRLPLKFGRVVLVEEYLPATIFDYFVLFKVRKVISRKSFNLMCKCALLLLSSIHARSYVIFLNAANCELYRRYVQRKSFREREFYLHMQRRVLPRLYFELLKAKVVFIDTTRSSILQTHYLIRSKVREMLSNAK